MSEHTLSDARATHPTVRLAAAADEAAPSCVADLPASGGPLDPTPGHQYPDPSQTSCIDSLPGGGS
jgi:hypothetical protein